MPAALDQEMLRLRAGVLLCRPGTDGREACQEFEAGVLLEAAFLGPDGRYLQASPARPAYGVLLLATPSSGLRDQSRSGECLVLLPRLALPHRADDVLPPVMMFVAGACVYRSDAEA